MDRLADGLPSHFALRAALQSARAQNDGGFSLDMGTTVVNRDGLVCAVAFTGAERGGFDRPHRGHPGCSPESGWSKTKTLAREGWRDR